MYIVYQNKCTFLNCKQPFRLIIVPNNYYVVKDFSFLGQNYFICNVTHLLLSTEMITYKRKKQVKIFYTINQ